MLHRVVRSLFYLALLFSPQGLNGVEGGEKTIFDELRLRHERAEDALEKKDFAGARTAYIEMLRLGAKHLVNKDTYVDIVLSLANIEIALKNFVAAEERVQALLKENLEDHQIIGIQSLRAQWSVQKKDNKKAYTILKELHRKVPMAEWPTEERSFIIGLEYSLGRHYGDLLRHAERLYDAALYEESLALYEEVLEAIEMGFYPEATEAEKSGEERIGAIRLRLAEANFESANYSKAVALLEPMAKELMKRKLKTFTPANNSIFYLLGLSYKKMGKIDHARKIFSTYSHFNADGLIHKDEVKWELALLHYERGELDDTERYLKGLATDGRNVKLYFLGRIYLSRIYLERKDYQKVEQTLLPLLGVFPENEMLRYEAAYLRAEAAFQLGDYKKSVELFEMAIPKNNRGRAKWYAETLYNLAWGYLKLGELEERGSASRARYFEKAEGSFKELILHNDDDRAQLALARVYLLREEVSELSQDIEELLGAENSFSNEDLEAEALILRGEVAATYQKRREIYERLTDDTFIGTRYYPLGWYYLGLVHFKEARRIAQNKNELEERFYLDLAIETFEKAFELLKVSHPEKAGLAIQYAGQANFRIDTLAARLESFALFETLFTDFNEIFMGMPNQDELLYLQAVVAARLMYQDGELSYTHRVVSVLGRIIEDYAEGDYVVLSLNLLGTVHFRQGNYKEAEEAFVRLGENYPHSEPAGDAWFWAGECADWQHRDPQIVKSYRQKVFENYPSSKHAAEAYFNYYSFSEYLQGDPAALTHLQSMELLHPQSSFLIVAHYLIGLESKRDRLAPEGTLLKKADYHAAIRAFEAARNVFDRAHSRNMIPKANFEYFITVRYRALLERALIKLKQAEEVEGAKRHVFLEWAGEAFEEVIKDFKDPENLLSVTIAKGVSYPRILEESEFGLVQVRIKELNDKDAEKILSRMLEQYANGKIKRGYYLSRAWYEQGKIAMRRAEYSLAIKFFSYAENAASGKVLNTDQRLDLWIQKSHCYRELKEFDPAMKMLSRVINEDVVSPLRLKAMFLRSEIYELQGRQELAVKQLEATKDKGGEWALKAKEKLEKEYGFN